MLRRQQLGHDVWALVLGYWGERGAVGGMGARDGDHRPRPGVCLHHRAAAQSERDRLQRPAAV